MSWVVGIHAVEAALHNKNRQFRRLLVLSGRHDRAIAPILTLAKQKHLTVTELSREALTTLVGQDKHQGVALEVTKSVQTGNENDLSTLLDAVSNPFLLILDGVQDPHNLGACLRTADGAGITGVIVPKDNAVGLNDTVAKVAAGAAESVPFFVVTNLARTMEQLKERGIWLYGFSDKAKSLVYQGDFTGPLAMVMGAEGKGLRQLTEKNCDVLYALPMLGQVSSLNVSVATGIVLYEALRQRSLVA